MSFINSRPIYACANLLLAFTMYLICKDGNLWERWEKEKNHKIGLLLYVEVKSTDKMAPAMRWLGGDIAPVLSMIVLFSVPQTHTFPA
jgi:hypothetical protein